MKTEKIEIGKFKAECPEDTLLFVVVESDGESGLYLNGNALRLTGHAFSGIAKMYEKKGTRGYLTAAELAAGLKVINDAVGPDYKLSVSYKGEELVSGFKDRSDDEKELIRFLSDVLMKALDDTEKKEDEDDDDDYDD